MTEKTSAALAVEPPSDWTKEVSPTAASELRRWSHRGLEVFYEPALDGGGTFLAAPFLQFIREHHWSGRPFGKLFEWCGGPGFLAFAALAEGLCETVCIADVNPRAIEMVQRTIAHNGLFDRVSCYVSDNLESIPASERFDLVVSNPPNFYAMNPAHPAVSSFAEDMRPNDPEWRIHEAFYASVARHLEPGALLLISEVEPHVAEMYAPRSEPMIFDRRPRPPIEDFKRMIEAGGLIYRDCVAYATWGEIELGMVVAQRA